MNRAHNPGGLGSDQAGSWVPMKITTVKIGAQTERSSGGVTERSGGAAVGEYGVPLGHQLQVVDPRVHHHGSHGGVDP